MEKSDKKTTPEWLIFAFKLWVSAELFIDRFRLDLAFCKMFLPLGTQPGMDVLTTYTVFVCFLSQSYQLVMAGT